MEWSSTPAPSSGYMFWIAPIHTPNMPVRRSPKYFHVSESGPSGSAGPRVARLGDVAAVLALFIELAVMVSSLSVSTHGCAVTIMLTTRVVHGLRARRIQKLCAGH